MTKRPSCSPSCSGRAYVMKGRVSTVENRATQNAEKLRMRVDVLCRYITIIFTDDGTLAPRSGHDNTTGNALPLDGLRNTITDHCAPNIERTTFVNRHFQLPFVQFFYCLL